MSRTSKPKKPKKKKGPSKEKAREILHDKTAHGHPLTAKQRRYMGAVASGKSKRPRSKRYSME